MNNQIVKLTVWERMTLLDVLGQQRGDVRTLRKALALMTMLELTDDEKVKVKFIQYSEQQYAWEDREYALDVEFNDGNNLAYLKELLKAHQFPVAVARLALAMLEKFGITD